MSFNKYACATEVCFYEPPRVFKYGAFPVVSKNDYSEYPNDLDSGFSPKISDFDPADNNFVDFESSASTFVDFNPSDEEPLSANLKIKKRKSQPVVSDSEDQEDHLSLRGKLEEIQQKGGGDPAGALRARIMRDMKNYQKKKS